MRSRVVAAISVIAALVLSVVVPPQPAYADAPVIKTTLAITGTTTPVVVRNLTDQSSCTIELNGTATGTVQGIEQGLTVNVQAVQIPDGGAPSTTITGPGQFTANCAGMQVFQFTPTAVTGTVTVTVIASGAVGRIIGAGVNGGRTTVVGSGPITVTNSGSTATVGLTVPLPILDGGTGATALPAGCLQSNGTVVSTTGTACASGSGTVTAVTGSGNIASSGGTTPNVSITNAPTFTGTVTSGAYGTATGATQGFNLGNSFGVTYITNYGATQPISGVQSNVLNINDSSAQLFALDGNGNVGISGSLYSAGLTAGSGHCLQAAANGQIVTTSAACSTSTGTVTGLTAGSNILVGTGPTPSVAVTAAPVFTKSVTIGASGAYSDNGSGLGSFLIGSGATSGFTDFITSNNAGNKVNGVQGNTYCVGQAVSNGCVYALDTSGNSGQLGTVTATGATLTGLTSGLCVQTTTGGTLTTAGSACGTGTVTGVTGTSPIVSSGGTAPAISCATCLTGLTAGSNAVVGTGTTPSVAVTAAPAFTSEKIGNNITLGTAGTDPVAGGGQVIFSNASAYQNQLTYMFPTQSDPVSTITPSIMGWGSQFNAFFAQDTSGNVGIPGAMHATNFIGSGAGLTSGTVPNASLVTAPVTSVSGTGNISSTGGTTPTVSITNAPTFTGQVQSGTLYNSGQLSQFGGLYFPVASASKCLHMNSSDFISSLNIDCPFGTTNATFVIPVVGSSVTVGTSLATTFPTANQPVTITDGTHSMAGLITVGGASMTIINEGVIAGAVGNTMGSGAAIIAGGFNQDFVNQAGTRLNGNHRETTPSLSVGTATTATFTFGTAYNAAPVCTVSTVGALAPTMSINATPSTTAVVIYNSGTAGTASVSCDGW